MPININAGGVTIDLDLGLHKFTQQLRAARTMYTAAVKQMQIGAAQAQAILTRAQAHAAQAPARQIANAAAQMVRAQANAQAQAVRATASALATQRRAQTHAATQMVRAQGAASAARIRAVGSIASGTIRALAAPINAVTRPLAAVVQAVTRLGGGGFGGLLGIGTGIGGGLSVVKLARDAMDMEKAVSRLGRAAGLEGQELESLGGKLKKFAATSAGVSTEHIFNLATFGAKLGIAGPSLELFTHDLTKMGMVLEDIPVEEAATGIARLINVFRRGNDEAINFASALNALDLASTANARDILDVTRRLAPMMAFLGAKPTHAMALATALREANVPVETAGTSITQVLGRMLQAKHARDFAKVAGMDPKAFTKTATTDPLKALTAFIKGLSTMDKLQGVRALDKLALDGQRVRGTLLLLVPVLDKLNGFVKTAEDEWSSLNSIMKGSASVAKTAWAQWERLKNNFTLTSAELGRGLLPAVKGLADGFVNLFTDIRHWAESNRATFERWGKSIGDAFRYIGVLMREWRTFGRLGASFLTEGWEKATTVIGRIWNGLWENIKTGAGNLIAGLEFLFKPFGDWLVDWASQVAAAMAAHIGNALKAALPPWMGGGGKPAPIPAIAPAPLKIDAAALARRMAPMPGFPGLLNNLPGRALERLPMFARLAAAVGLQKRNQAIAGVQQNAQDMLARLQAQGGRALAARPKPRPRRINAQQRRLNAARARAAQRRQRGAAAFMRKKMPAVQRGLGGALGGPLGALFGAKFVDQALRGAAIGLNRAGVGARRPAPPPAAGGRFANIPDDVRRKILAAEAQERRQQAKAQAAIDKAKREEAARAKAILERKAAQARIQAARDEAFDLAGVIGARAASKMVPGGIGFQVRIKAAHRKDLKAWAEFGDILKQRDALLRAEQAAPQGMRLPKAKPKPKGNQAVAAFPMGGMRGMIGAAMLGGLPEKRKGGVDPAWLGAHLTVGTAGNMAKVRGSVAPDAAEAAFRAKMAKINAGADFGVANVPRKAGQGPPRTFSPAAGGAQGASGTVGPLNMLGDAFKPFIRWSEAFGNRAAEAMYHRAAELNRMPAAGPGRQASRGGTGSGMTEATAVKLIASMEALRQTNSKLLEPGKLAGHWT